MLSSPFLIKSASLALALAGSVNAQAAAGPSRTDEASAAQSTDPAQECTPYSFPPIESLKSNFPTIWQIADLLPQDAVAMSLFQSLNSSIPPFPAQGTPTGDFSAFTPTYPADDPHCWWTYHQCTTPKTDGLPPDIVKCDEPDTWGLTYDDGPNCSHNAFYDYLQSQNQKATLFYIGSNLLDWPLEGQRGLADGHEICAHTWSHRYMTSLTNEQAFAELYYSKKAIKDVLGVTPQCWRPPYGDVDDRIRYIANALGMSTIIWVENTFDYEFATLGLPAVEQNYRDILAKGANGTYSTDGPIVLSHELTNETMTEAQKFLPQIHQAFKHVVPVAVCQNNTRPYVEQDVVYPNFSQYAAGTTTISLVAPTISDAAVSIPLSSGQSGSVTGSTAYHTGAQPGASAGGSGSGSSAMLGARTPALRDLLMGTLVAVGVAGGFGWIATLI